MKAVTWEELVGSWRLCSPAQFADLNVQYVFPLKTYQGKHNNKKKLE